LDRRTIYLIWAGGAVLAFLIFVAGPDRVLTQLAYSFDALMWDLRGVGGAVYNLIRASAIAVFVVFWVLGVIAIQRGRHGISVLLWFTLICWWLVGSPSHWANPTPLRDWLAALLVSALGASIMTGRLGRAGK